jgi:hypothetical protein
MGSVFRSFFNDVNEAIGNVQEANNYERRNEIRAENSREAAQGAQDAFAGRGPRSELENDMDYMDAFRGISGQRLGRDLANQFNNDYLDWRQENPHGDVDEFREQWALEAGIDGIADPEIAAAAADQFFGATDGTVRQHGEDSFRIRQNEDLTTMGAEIAAEVADGTLTVERIQWYMSAAEQIDPLNPHQAAPRVIARLLEGAQQYPGRSEQIIGLLEQPGTGVNGQSFAQSFPEAYNDFQEGALTRYVNENSLAENELFNGIEESIAGAGNITELNDALLRLNAGHGIYGNGRRYESLRNAAAQRIEEFAQQAADINNTAGMLQGAITQDPAFLREHFMDFFEAANGTRSILEADPATAAAQIAATNGAVPSDVHHQLSAALLNSSNPEAQEQAFQILNGISEARDGNIGPYLNDEATRFWNNIGARRATGESVNGIITQANANRADGINPNDVDWLEVTGTDTRDGADAQVASWITSGVNNYLGSNGWFDGDGDVAVPPHIRRQIENYARLSVAEGYATGRDPETVFNEAVAEVMGNVSVGGTTGEPVLFLESSADVGPDGNPPIRLGFNVTSPYNGSTVNTHEIYTNELEELSETAPWITPDGNFDEVRVRPSASSPGRYDVMDSTGASIQFTMDEGITWDGVNYSFNTEDPEVLNQMFDGVIPEGFGFERVDTLQGPGWRLMYQPHVGEEGRRTVGDAAEEFGFYGETTPEEELNNMQQALMAAQREAGLTQPGMGISGSPTRPQSAQEILDLMEEQMWRGVSWNGRNVVNRARTGQASYRTARREMFTGADGIQTSAYDGPNGNRRVGIGFDMDRENARETWTAVFGDEVDFDAVRRGEEELTTQQARDLFDYDMTFFENLVSVAAGGEAMPEHRHLSLVSIAHSNPEFVQRVLASDLMEENHGAVIEAILYEGFGDQGSSGAMAARRYREAMQYAGSNRALQALIPEPNEYLQSRRLGLPGATPSGADTMGEGFIDDVIGSLTGTESSGNPAARNNVPGAGGDGHFGLLQFSRSRFAEAQAAGVVPRGMTIEEFATEENVEVQQAANRWHVEDIVRRAEGDGLTQYIGQTINGVEVTMSGMVAVAHLGGYNGMKNFLQSGGRYNPSDVYGTSLSSYLGRHAGIEGYGQTERVFASASRGGSGRGMIVGTDGTPEPRHFREMNPEVQERFRGISAAFGQPLQITPHGGRSPRSSQSSRHVHGDAMDVYVADMSPAERTRLIAIAISMGATGIGGYEPGSGSSGVGTIHIDFRPRGDEGNLGGISQWWRTGRGDVGYSEGAPWFVAGIEQGLQLWGENRGR